MKHLFKAGTLAMMLALTACEKSDDDDNVSAQDRNFVNQMTISNRTEIVLSNMALQKSTDDSVRMFAQMMVMEHTTADFTLGELADDLDIDVPADSVDADGALLRTTLMALNGRAFDSAYITGQVPAHQQSLQIAQNEVNSGTNNSLRGFASSMSPKIQAHLEHAQRLADQY